jgi:hypothetical protein
MKLFSDFYSADIIVASPLVYLIFYNHSNNKIIILNSMFLNQNVVLVDSGSTNSCWGRGRHGGLYMLECLIFDIGLIQRDYDFLSSIEILCIDGADMIAMQVIICTVHIFPTVLL